MQRLQGKVAIITGGAQGIGKATALLFAKEGAKIALWDLNEEKGNETAQALQDLGAEAYFESVNTAGHESVVSATENVMSKWGKIDILINNAGITRDATLLKMEPTKWQQVIDVNLTGVFNCTHAIAPHMVEKGYGKIISASSVVGIYGNFGQTNYVATKSGVIGMTKVWARELGPKGINVNAIAPGFIATEMIDTIPEKIIKGVESRTPLRRFGKPEEIAEAYVFLASEAASFINGHTLSVDGGITI
ncbi:MAG: 3-oxoacyl-ACP reductase FabG [Bacteroidota bacterium]